MQVKALSFSALVLFSEAFAFKAFAAVLPEPFFTEKVGRLDASVIQDSNTEVSKREAYRIPPRPLSPPPPPPPPESSGSSESSESSREFLEIDFAITDDGGYVDMDFIDDSWVEDFKDEVLDSLEDEYGLLNETCEVKRSYHVDEGYTVNVDFTAYNRAVRSQIEEMLEWALEDESRPRSQNAFYNRGPWPWLRTPTFRIIAWTYYGRTGDDLDGYDVELEIDTIDDPR